MKQIEYFYSAHSAFAYLGHPKLLEIKETYGLAIKHRPIALSPVIEAAGGLPFGSRTQMHVDYFFGRQLERWAEVRSLQLLSHRPTYHDASLDLANGMLIAAIEADIDVDRLSFALFQGHWRDDIDLDDKEALSKAAAAIGIDPEPLLEVALSEAIQRTHRLNTQEATDRGVFGSPTYFFDGEMFYGQDYLEMLVRAIKKPFAKSDFKNPNVNGQA